VPRHRLSRPLAAALALLAAAPALSRGDGNGTDTEPPEREDTWLDTGHSFIEDRIFWPAIRFDRFFSDERDDELERGRSFLQWRSVLRLDDAAAPSYQMSVRANLRFPGFNAWLGRLRLVIEGRSREALASVFPDAPEPGDTIGSANAGLRFAIWRSLVSAGDVSAGVLVQLPPGVFTRLRLRWAFPVGSWFLTRAATSGFWRTDTRFGTSADLVLERSLSAHALLRLVNQALLTQRSRGVEYSSEIDALVALDQKTAGAVLAGYRSATGAPSPLDRYRVATRLRRQFYREWLFLEVEPEVYWPWILSGPRPTEVAVTMRLDVQFSGARRSPEPAVPLGPPEQPAAEPETPGEAGAPATPERPPEPAPSTPPEASPAAPETAPEQPPAAGKESAPWGS
jgi:hypothetical protein